ncbi:hypothetical protein [Compostibacter hankyongensis]|uniref:WxL domain-containing protein n=1 Tax=Compostibacter hankyongensis TaxID=1007089 RepID=A0ABP8FQ44_9BACT
MKKCFLYTMVLPAILLGLHQTAKGQNTTGTTTLKIRLVDALNITVNQSEVELAFETAGDYQAGKQVLMANHLTVSSNQAYSLNVKAADADLPGTASGNAATIAANTVSVTLQSGDLGNDPTPVTLSTTDQQLVTEATPVMNKNIDVEYAIPGTVSSTDAILGKPADTYHTTLTYTISQD